MRAKHGVMAAVLAVAAEAPATMQDHLLTSPARVHVEAPVWPSDGIAERELGDGEETWPENMFVEHSKGRWTVWVLLSPVRGQARAMDFFSGEVQDITVQKPGEYNDSFVDSNGVAHASSDEIAFYFKDPRPGGAIGNTVQLNVSSLRFDRAIPCRPRLHVSQRIADDGRTVIWRKVLLFGDPASSTCSGRTWSSLIGTGLELRDGTMLITGGKYVFRLREDDLAPVGRAPHLHVVDEADVKRVIDKAEGSGIKDANTFLAEQLRLL